MCVRPGPKNPAASTCAREGSNRERASRLSYSVGGALHGAQKGLGMVWAHFLIVGDATGKEVAGATRVSRIMLERSLAFYQRSSPLINSSAALARKSQKQQRRQVLVSAPILSGPLESAKHHKQKRTHTMMMMTKTTRAALGHQQVLVLFHLGRSAEHGRGANFSLYLREPTGRFVIKAKFYGPRKSLSRA